MAKARGRYELAASRDRRGLALFWCEQTSWAASTLIALHISVEEWTGREHACVISQSACNDVLKSAFSHIAGVPVSALGAAASILMLLLGFHRSLHGVEQRGAAKVLALLMLASVLVFQSISAFILRSACYWCVAYAVAVCIGFAFLVSNKALVGPMPFRSRTIAYAALFLCYLALGYLLPDGKELPKAKITDSTAWQLREAAGLGKSVLSNKRRVYGFLNADCPASRAAARDLLDIKPGAGAVEVHLFWIASSLEGGLPGPSASHVAALLWETGQFDELRRFLNQEMVLDGKVAASIPAEPPAPQTMIDKHLNDSRDLANVLGIASTPTWLLEDRGAFRVVPTSEVIWLIRTASQRPGHR